MPQCDFYYFSPTIPAMDSYDAKIFTCLNCSTFPTWLQFYSLLEPSPRGGPLSLWIQTPLLDSIVPSLDMVMTLAFLLFIWAYDNMECCIFVRHPEWIVLVNLSNNTWLPTYIYIAKIFKLAFIIQLYPLTTFLISIHV